MTTEATCLCSGYVLSHLSMAGFNPIIYGRFWVITEAGTADRPRQSVVVTVGDLLWDDIGAKLVVFVMAQG